MKLGFWNSWGKGQNGLGVVGKPKLPFFQDFSLLSDGALPVNWFGSTWTIVSGKAINIPTLGTELLINGNMETGDPPSNWSAVTAVLSAAVDERTGGSGTKSINVANSGTNFGQARQAITLEAGAWYVLSGWMKNITASGRINVVDSTWLRTSVSTASWALYATTGRSPDTSDTVRCSNQTNVDTQNCHYDDLSLKKLTQSTLWAIRNTGRRDVNIQGTYSTLVVGTQIGILSNVKADLSAGLVAWIDGTNIKLEQWTSAGWLTLINTTQTPTGGLLPQIKTVISDSNLLVDLLYNGSAIGTQQMISNAEIVNNTYAGLLSTYDGNQIATFSAIANP